MLADCHESLLQRIIDRCDASDLFLLRQVCKRLRDAVAQRVRRVRLTAAPSDLASLTSLDLHELWHQECPWLPLALEQLPHLRELLNANSSYHTIPVQTLQGLTRLELYNAMAGGRLSGFAAHCPLERLELIGCQPEFPVLCTVVAQLGSTLTHLDLCLTLQDLQGEGLQALNTGVLRCLSLRAHRLPANVCQQLAAFTSLDSLDLSRTHYMSDGDLPHLNALTRLTALSLRKSGVSAAGLAQLTALTGLAALNLHTLGGYITHNRPRAVRGLPAALACFTSLTDLTISDCNCGNISSALGSLTRLTRLAAADSAGLLQQALLGLPVLRVLEVQGCVGTETQLRHLSGLRGLTRLSLTGTTAFAGVKLSEIGVRWLARLTALQHLCLAGCTLIQGALEQLAQLPALTVLDLDRAQLPWGWDLSPLKRLPLQRLRLPGGLVADGQLPPALQVPLLKGQRWDDRQWGASD